MITPETLNSVGVETCDSGDGAKSDMGCAVDFPHVAGEFDPEKLRTPRRLEELADFIAEACERSRFGEKWRVEIGWSTTDRKWVWFACPAYIYEAEPKA